LGHPVVSPLRPAIFDRHALTLDVAFFVEAPTECRHHARVRLGRCAVEEPDHRHRCLLRPSGERPSGSRAPRRRSPITHGSALVAFERSKLAQAPLIRSRRKYWLPRLDIPPRRCLPPVEFCRGTRPSQAANSRPLRKPLGSTTVAARAVAM